MSFESLIMLQITNNTANLKNHRLKNNHSFPKFKGESNLLSKKSFNSIYEKGSCSRELGLGLKGITFASSRPLSSFDEAYNKIKSDLEQGVYENKGIQKWQNKYILEALNEENIDYFPMIVNENVFDSTNFRFDSYSTDIWELLPLINKDNSKYFEKVLKAKSLDNKSYRFDSHGCAYFLKTIKDSKIDYFNKLFDAKTLDGKKYRFEDWSISYALEHLNENTLKYFDKLFEAKDVNNAVYRFNNQAIGDTLRNINDNNFPIFNKLFEAQYLSKPAYRFNEKAIGKVLENINEANFPIFNKLFEARLSNNSDYRFNEDTIGEVLEAFNDESYFKGKEEYFEQLFNAKFINSNLYLFDSGSIPLILSRTSEDSKNILDLLLKRRLQEGDKSWSDFNSQVFGIMLETKNKDIADLECLIDFRNKTPVYQSNKYFLTNYAKLFEYKLPVKKIINEKFINSLTNAEKLILLKFYENVSRYDSILKDLIELPPAPLLPTKKDDIEKLIVNLRKSLSGEEDNCIVLDNKLIQSFYDSLNSLDDNLKDCDLERYAKTGLPIVSGKFVLADNQVLANNLNKIREIFPEFMTCVGKKQNLTHLYTLDIHLLKTLQEFINDPSYQKLSQYDRKISKLAILFHDISKEEGVVDKEHPEKSAMMARRMMKRLKLTDQELGRIFGLVNNHHWVEELEHKYKSIDDVAFAFRRPVDFDIVVNLAKADLKAVGNKRFYESLKDNYLKYVDQIQTKLDNIHSTAIYLPQTRIPKASEINSDKVKLGAGGEQTENMVIQVNKNTDFEALGFDKETTYNNFYAIIHAVEASNEDIVVNLSHASKDGNDGVFSTSYITPDNYHTWLNFKYAVAFEVDPNNIGLAYDKTIGTGTKKGLRNFKEFIFANVTDEKMLERTQNARVQFANTLKNELKTMHPDYSQEALEKVYRKLFKKLSQYPSLTDIQNPNLRKLVESTVKKSVLSNTKSNNEQVVYAPKPKAVVTKDISVDKIPYHLRKYAQDHDLPVIIL